MKCLGQNKICANESSDPIGATSHYKHKFLIIRRLLFPCKVVRCKISLHGNHAKTLNLKSEAQTQTLRNTIMQLKTVRFTKCYFTLLYFTLLYFTLLYFILFLGRQCRQKFVCCFVGWYIFCHNPYRVMSYTKFLYLNNPLYIRKFIDIYRVSQEERTKLREGVPYVKLYRYNPKHLCPKLNGFRDNGK